MKLSFYAPLLTIGALVLVGCGSSSTKGPKSFAEVPEEGFTDSTAVQAPMSAPPLTELSRADVDLTLKNGIGRFLQEARLDAELVDGKFVGFRVRSFVDRKKWEGVGIEIGDVITKVNDLPIERPEQAYEAFIALKTRKSLDVTYLRGEEVMHLSLPIVGESAPQPPTAPPFAAPPAPAPKAPGKAKSEEPKKP